MKVRIFLPALFVTFILLSAKAHAQESSSPASDTPDARYELFSTLASPEKLYLHTDKNIYSTGETVWLKGYLENKSLLSELPESNFIYVELCHADTLVRRIKIKRNDNGFSGYIPIAHTLTSGTYLLRGYSRWMADFSEEYMFHKEIRIVDGIHSKQGENTVSEAEHGLAEVNFYPESGSYLTNQPANVAFKANDKYGRGIEVNGELFNGKDSLIATFFTQHQGMGFFSFFPVKGESYHAVVKDGNGQTLKVQLPKAADAGAAISLRKREGKVYIAYLLSEELLQHKPFLAIHNGSQLFYKEHATQTGSSFALPEKELLSGINHVVLADAKGNIYAERIFFVYPPTEQISTLSPNASAYGKREKAEFRLTLKDSNGQPIQGSFSLAVTDSFMVPYHEGQENISSYMLLSSELKGAIENPGYYFNTSIDRRAREAAIDLLMMVQGWRYYDIPAIFTSKTVMLNDKEYSQQLSGKATALFKNSKGALISIAAPTINLALSDTLNSKGRFTVANLNFADSTEFIFSAARKKGQLFVDIDQEHFPPIKAYRAIPSQYKQWKDLDESYKDISKALYTQTGDIQQYVLEEAQVTAAFIRPKYNPSPFNQPFERRQLKERKDLEPYDVVSLKDYLRTNYPNLFSGLAISAKGNNNPLVYIDHVSMGNIGLDQDYTSDSKSKELPRVGDSSDSSLGMPKKEVDTFSEQGDASAFHLLKVSDVETLAVLRGSEAGALYRSSTSVILITTRRSVGRQLQAEAKSPIAAVTPLGWQKPAKFYSPSYALSEDKNRTGNDVRTTLLWEPNLKTDREGKASISFYTADRSTRFRFIVEGIANDGSYVSTANVTE